ncbi:hypothetical protein Tco_0969276 [Tanacetum coccineum]
MTSPPCHQASNQAPPSPPWPPSLTLSPPCYPYLTEPSYTLTILHNYSPSFHESPIAFLSHLPTALNPYTKYSWPSRVLKSRNHKSIINTVKDVQCNLFQEEEVADQFVKHFNNFLGIEVPVKDFGPFLPLIKKKLSPTDADFMKAWDIVGKDKAWDIVGKDVCKYVKEFFDNGKMLKEINSTLITLIPKIETPDKIMSLIVHDKVERNKEFGYHFRCKHMKLTHVCFADDLLMFCYGDKGDISNRKAKVAWKNICRPKSKGGLGLKDLGAVNEEIYDSWGWKSMLRLRDEVRNFIVMRIGNGEKAFVIYDNWCGTDALQSFITHRDLYNVRWHDRMVVKDIAENGVCVWPAEWTRKYPDLAMNNKVMINNGKEDEIVWRSKNRKEDKFSIRRVYQDLYDNEGDVKWHKIIWFS